MAISSDLIKDFVKVTNDNKPTKSESTLYGKIVIYDDREYVQLDGSDVLTPVSSTASVEAGERVMVQIKNHTATVTGNMSSPSASSGTVKKLAENVTEFEAVVAERIEVTDAEIENLQAENVRITGLLDADKAVIDELKAKNVTIEGTLMANEADIEDLKTNKLDATVAHLEFATVNELEAVNADIHNLEATYGDFTVLTTEKFKATDAEINNLDTKYAEIDFSNINQAAVEKLFTESGIIEDLVVSEGKITGELVGVTIKGDLIEGGTVKADKLVVKGSDGLYYKLNTEGGATTSEQVSEEDLQNGLSGSIIVAKSITASKIAVDDLVAFDATIGGFNITDDAIYSGVKGAVESPSRGIYLDNTGQIAFGDGSNYLKYFLDEDGYWKLEIAAKTITFGGGSKSIEEAIGDLQNNIDNIVVGGRNLIKTSNPIYVTSTMEVNIVKPDNYTANLIYGDSTKDTFFELRFYGILKTGVEYTISFDCEGVEEGVEPIYRVQYSTGDRNFTLVNGRVSKTFVLSQDNTSGFLLLDDANTNTTRPSNTNIILSNFKLEKGNVATDYTPAPEDAQTAIDGIYDGLVNDNLLTRTRDFGGGWSIYPVTRVGYGYEDGFTYVNFPKEPEDGANRYVYNHLSALNLEDVWGREVVLSYEIRADEAWTATSDNFALEFAAPNESAMSTRIKYRVIYRPTEITTKWVRHEYKATINEAFLTGGSGSLEDCTHLWIRIYNTTNKPLQIRKIKLEYGSVMTDWSAAAEDAGYSGGRNLILDSNYERSSALYCVNAASTMVDGRGGHYVPSTPLIAGEEYTITACVTPAEGVKCYNINASYGNMNQCYLYVNGTEKQITSCTYKPRYASGYTPEDDIINANLLFYRLPNDGTVTDASTIHWIKVEKGTQATDWTPAPEDTQTAIDNVEIEITSTRNTVENTKVYTHKVLSVDGGSTLASFDFSGHMESGTLTVNGADTSNSSYVRSYEYVKLNGGSKYSWNVKDSDGTAKTPTAYFYTYDSASEAYTSYSDSQSTDTITVPTGTDVYMRFTVEITKENMENSTFELKLSDLDSIVNNQTSSVYIGIYTTLDSYMSVDVTEYEWELTETSSYKSMEDLVEQLSNKLYNDTDGSINILNLGIEAAKKDAGDAQDAADNAQNSVDQLDDKLYNEKTGDIYKIDGNINDINERLGHILIKPEEPSITLLTTPPDPDDPEKEAIGSRVVINNEKVSFQQKRSEESGLTEGAYIGYVGNERTAMAATSAYITETYPRVENPNPTSEEDKWIGNLCWIARTNGHLSLKVVN